MRSFLVFGPESSGTKLVGRILAQHLDLPGAATWSGGGKLDGPDGSVLHRSLPEGRPEGRPLWPALAEELATLPPRAVPVACVRDAEIAARSKARVHVPTRDLQVARWEVDRAGRMIVEAMGDPRLGDLCVVSYEALCLLGIPYLQHVLRPAGVVFRAGFAPAWSQESQNLKYLGRGETP